MFLYHIGVSQDSLLAHSLDLMDLLAGPREAAGDDLSGITSQTHSPRFLTHLRSDIDLLPENK